MTKLERAFCHQLSGSCAFLEALGYASYQSKNDAPLQSRLSSQLKRGVVAAGDYLQRRFGTVCLSHAHNRLSWNFDLSQSFRSWGSHRGICRSHNLCRPQLSRLASHLRKQQSLAMACIECCWNEGQSSHTLHKHVTSPLGLLWLRFCFLRRQQLLLLRRSSGFVVRQPTCSSYHRGGDIDTGISLT